jgi:hypothetical protein
MKLVHRYYYQLYTECLFTWPFVTEWLLALCGITIALILLSLFCTICTTLNVVSTDIISLPYTNKDLWKVVFAYAIRKPLYAIVAQSYRRTRFIVNTLQLNIAICNWLLVVNPLLERTNYTSCRCRVPSGTEAMLLASVPTKDKGWTTLVRKLQPHEHECCGLISYRLRHMPAPECDT